MAVRFGAGSRDRRGREAWPLGSLRLLPAGAIARAFEREEGRLILWWPVGLGAGIAAYFALDFEPDWHRAAAAAVAAAVAVCMARGRRQWLLAAALATLAVSLGFAIAAWRGEWVAAPVVSERLGPVEVEGVVREVAARSEARIGLRIAPETISSREPVPLPSAVRVTMSATQARGIEPGERVRLLAILLPPPGPVAPGAYDFARDAWFDRLGAVGFAVSGVERLGRSEAGLWAGLADGLERLRTRTALRIRSAVPGDEGAIAAALLTGKRGAISEEALSDIRDAGLAHLLAISGLHMALVCGAVFGAAGLFLAGVPGLALRITVKKWAAAAALAAGLGYYLLAGGSVATERAFVMAAISLAAVMLDRPVITMRNVAVAATVTLALRPESINQAGFQMSFGAVIALVAFYEGVRRARDRWPDRPRPPRGPLAWAGLTIAAVAATTVVATLATGPLAAHHFNRVAVYGLVANLIAVPLAGFVVMPLGLVALAGMPFGLEGPPLGLMAAGIGVIVDVATAVASWEGSVRLVPATPTLALALFAAGGLWLCLWRGAVRWFGLAPLALCVIVATTARGPDLLVARDAANAAVRGGDGALSVARSRGAGYSVEQWLRRDGDGRSQAEAARGAFACDHAACVARAAGGRLVSYVLRRGALAEDCWRADILVSAIPVIGECAAPVVIDLIDARRRGPHAAWLEPDGTVTVVDTASLRGARPWAGARVAR